MDGTIINIQVRMKFGKVEIEYLNIKFHQITINVIMLLSNRIRLHLDRFGIKRKIV